MTAKTVELNWRLLNYYTCVKKYSVSIRSLKYTDNSVEDIGQ